MCSIPHPALPCLYCRERRRRVADFRRCALLLALLLPFFDLRPGVAKSDGAIEDQSPRFGILVHAEVTEPLKLEAAAGNGIAEAWLQTGSLQHLERVRIQIGAVILSFRYIVRIGFHEKMIVQANFCGKGMLGGDPVNRALDLAAVRSVAAACSRVVSAMQLH